MIIVRRIIAVFSTLMIFAILVGIILLTVGTNNKTDDMRVLSSTTSSAENNIAIKQNTLPNEIYNIYSLSNNWRLENNYNKHNQLVMRNQEEQQMLLSLLENKDVQEEVILENIDYYYSDVFNHGYKDPTNQKYIMIHDTEVDTSPLRIAQSWENANNGIAAHFVIGRDGSIVQCVDLNQITHHAGWGGPGNYDEIFNVGNNDLQGTGDDMEKTTYLNGYTSYGMNSYSIGIELVHITGQDYPIEQLESLDLVIAYIDSMFDGNGGDIITHKDWRPSNPDTDDNFDPFLESYQQTRTYSSIPD